ncbi:MAG TPA: hypothetical protein VI112_17475 [Bacteroidia bacterium]|jgi:uncharacterized protein (TIGR03067 family)
MKCNFSLFTLLLLSSIGFSNPGKKGFDITGTWEGIESVGTKPVTMIFKTDSSLIFIEKGDTVKLHNSSVSYALDPSPNPKWLDIVFTFKTGQKEHMQCLLKVNSPNKIKISYRENSRERPTDFNEKDPVMALSRKK